MIGIDVDRGKVDALNSGESHVEDVRAERVRALSAENKLRFTDDFELISEASATVVGPPTPLDEQSDTYCGRGRGGGRRPASGAWGARRPREHHLPGHHRGGAAAAPRERGLGVGEDFFLAFSPERVDPGNPTLPRRANPRSSAAYAGRAPSWRARSTRSASSTVIPVSSTRAAEMAKLLENTFRSVNIALANEMALMCDVGIDVWEVIDAAATKPFGFMPFYPGPGHRRALHPDRPATTCPGGRASSA